MKCSNCKGPIEFFAKKRECRECKLRFCKICFNDDPDNHEITKAVGWCLKCYINVESSPTLEKRAEIQVIYI